MRERSKITPELELKLREFRERFKTEQDCLNYLKLWKWPNGFICPKCGFRESYYFKDRNLYQCKDKDCKYEASIKVGTVFENSKIELMKLFSLIFLISQLDIRFTTIALKRQLGFKSYKTVWSLRKKIEKILEEDDANERLVGLLHWEDALGHFFSIEKKKKLQLRKDLARLVKFVKGRTLS